MTHSSAPIINVTYRNVHVFRKNDGTYQSTGSADHQQDLRDCLMLARGGAYRAHLDDCLTTFWEPLLAERRIFLVMIEEATKTQEKTGEWSLQTRPIGFRFMCFTMDSFYQTTLYEAGRDTLKPSLCTHIFNRHKAGRSPILTRREVARANAGEGLSLFSFTVHADSALETAEGVRAYASAAVMAFRDLCSGYQSKCAIIEGCSSLARQQIPLSGFDMLPGAYRTHYADQSVHKEHQLFLAHVHRKDFHQKGGTDVYNSSAYSRPVLENLSLLQRETLEFALEGVSDEVQAQHYGVTEEAIRQRFTDIFKRVREVSPPQLAMQKGAERACLLAYLRNRLEEVRPYAH